MVYGLKYAHIPNLFTIGPPVFIVELLTDDRLTSFQNKFLPTQKVSKQI